MMEHYQEYGEEIAAEEKAKREQDIFEHEEMIKSAE